MRYSDLLYSLLEWDNRVVGIRMIKNRDEFESVDSQQPLKPMNYCGMVKAATLGRKMKATADNFSCRSGPRVLGIDPSDLRNSNGELWNELGLYENKTVSAGVRKGLTYVPERSFGVFIAPIESFDTIPDVVLCLTNSYNVMRLVQAYTFRNGIASNLQMVGNQAVCYECTARVLCTEEINISTLCIGTRHRANWDNGRMCIGIHKKVFPNVIDGLLQTVNPMESDKNKKLIRERLNERGLDSTFIIMNDNYYRKV